MDYCGPEARGKSVWEGPYAMRSEVVQVRTLHDEVHVWRVLLRTTLMYRGKSSATPGSVPRAGVQGSQGLRGMCSPWN